MVFEGRLGEMGEPWEVYIDGASRGNPGPSAYAYVLKAPTGEKYVGSSYIGISTNNRAEYMALINALVRAKKLGCKKLIVYSDSQLLARQLNGEYAVRDVELKILYQKAKLLMKDFDSVKIVHVARDENVEADALASSVLKRLGRKKMRR